MNQHDFFISKDRVLEEAENTKSPVDGENGNTDMYVGLSCILDPAETAQLEDDW